MAELLNELLGYVDEKKRQVANFAQMLRDDPETAWEYVKSAAGDQLREYQQAPGAMATDVLGVVPLPAAKGLAAAGAAGIIRRGGLPELVAVHQAPLERYALWAQERGKLPQELYSPSIAINKGAISQDFGSESGGTLHLVGRPDALDPARLNARLYNRDAYTPRDTGSHYVAGRSELLGQNMSQIPPTMDPLRYKRNFAEDRLADRELVRTTDPLPRDLRFLETATADLMPAEHVQSIRSSPSFRSFKEFEANPRGASLLGESSIAPNAAALKANRELEAAMFQLERAGNPAARAFLEKQAQYMDEPTGRGLAQNLGEWRKIEGARDVEKALRDYRKALAYLPSQYAELKVSGPLQIRSNNFAGAILSPPQKASKLYQPESVNKLAELLRQRGIPTMVNDPSAPLSPQDLGWLARAYSEGVLK